MDFHKAFPSSKQWSFMKSHQMCPSLSAAVSRPQKASAGNHHFREEKRAGLSGRAVSGREVRRRPPCRTGAQVPLGQGAAPAFSTSQETGKYSGPERSLSSAQAPNPALTLTTLVNLRIKQRASIFSSITLGRSNQFGPHRWEGAMRRGGKAFRKLAIPTIVPGMSPARLLLGAQNK